MGSDLYAHDKSANQAVCVMRNDRTNISLKNTPIRKAVVRLQKEQVYLNIVKSHHIVIQMSSLYLFVCYFSFLITVYVNWFCQTSIARPLPS